MDEPKDGEVLVFPGVDRPVAVPQEVVLEAQRPYRAYQAHEKGLTWEQIAAVEGYPSGRSVREDVRRYLTEGRALVQEWSRAELLSIEMARLDTLQAAIWDAAIGGKLPAVALVRDLIVTRIKMQKLDETADEDSSKARTVVIMGETDDFQAALTKVLDD